MRKGLLYGSGLLILLSILFSTGACTDKKPIKDDSVAVDTGNVDSTSADTLETLLSEQPMPKAADELFDDFFFNFAANRKLQRKRILFPLPVYENGKVVRTIAKDKWKIDNFFMRQDFYTLIFDNAKQMKVVKDTTINHVVVEKIYLTNNSIKQYLFNRIHGEWMLTSLNVHPIRQNSHCTLLGLILIMTLVTLLGHCCQSSGLHLPQNCHMHLFIILSMGRNIRRAIKRFLSSVALQMVWKQS